jgi:DNA-binding IclR family transcriptional regulator
MAKDGNGDTRSSATRVQVVERAIDILGVLAKGRATLSEVTRDVGLPKGTTFRILGALQYEKLVVKDPVDSSYQLGPGFLRLSQTQTPWFGALTMLAEPAMSKLLEAARETVAVHVRVGSERICVAELASPQQIRYSAEVGALVPIYVGAAGKVLLAQLEGPALERLLGALDLEPLTGDTIHDRGDLVAAVERAREDGYAQSVGERVASAAAISVPIALDSQFGASLSLLGPADRFTEEARLARLDDLLAAAKEVAAAAAGSL